MQYARVSISPDTGRISSREAIGEHVTISEAAKRFRLSRDQFRTALVRMHLLQEEYDNHAEQFRRRLSPLAVAMGLGFRINPNTREAPSSTNAAFDALSEKGIAYIAERLPGVINELITERESLSERARKAASALASYEAARKENHITRPRKPLMGKGMDPATRTERLATLLNQSRPTWAPSDGSMDTVMRVSWLLDHCPDLNIGEVAKVVGASERQVHRYVQARKARLDLLRRNLEIRSRRLPPAVTMGEALARYEDVARRGEVHGRAQGWERFAPYQVAA